VISGTHLVMIPFKPISDDDPALAYSPMLRAASLTFEYIEANGPIGLTPSKALKRYFVEWAAEAFAWPYHTPDDLYAVNTVLNEQDFLPLMVLHDVLLSAKLVRHYEGAMHMTKLAKQLRTKPAFLAIHLTNHLLAVIDHSEYTRFGDQLVGDWSTLLHVIDREAHVGVNEARLCAVLFGGSEKDALRDSQMRSILYLHVLRPLCWAGLLEEHRQGRGFDRVRLFVKTPLWAAALDLGHAEHDSAPAQH
jgi:hypothetical protein